jgi:hypothetical protein
MKIRIKGRESLFDIMNEAVLKVWYRKRALRNWNIGMLKCGYATEYLAL